MGLQKYKFVDIHRLNTSMWSESVLRHNNEQLKSHSELGSFRGEQGP